MLKRIVASFLIVILIGLILNVPVEVRQGMNGVVRVYKIPFYIKTIEFLGRNYQYKRLAGEITSGCYTNKEKTMALLDWVVKNIRKPPKGFDIFDDHVLNIIIRRYGLDDQMADVFTTLCIYSGVPAVRIPARLQDGRKSITLSYVLLDDKWRVFDVYRNLFFLNKTGEIASVEDIISDISIVKSRNIKVEDIAYEEFFKYPKPINTGSMSKEQKQVPFFRIMYEIRCLFGLEK